jgi:hypothetical protein
VEGLFYLGDGNERELDRQPEGADAARRDHGEERLGLAGARRIHGGNFAEDDMPAPK